MKRRFTTHHGPWRSFTDTPPGPPPPRQVGGGHLRVTFVNHATVLIQMDGVNVLTDPMWSERSAPVVGNRRHRPPGIRFDDLPRIDAVLVSHDHHDHLDLPTLSRLSARDHPLIVVGLGNAGFLSRQRIPGGKDLDWWQSLEIAPGVSVTAVPARHMSGRGLFDHDRTLWCGYVLTGPAGSVYFAGDTGWGSHFGEIGKRFRNLSLALLPIGGFKPLWYMREQHLGPQDALAASAALQAAVMVPVHFGTFVDGDDGELEPVETLRAALAAAPEPQPRVVILDNGQSTDLEPVLGGHRAAATGTVHAIKAGRTRRETTMIAAVQSDEHESTTKREVCARCRKPVIPHEETDRGPLCRPCTLEATEIRLEYIIDGGIYSKSLKGRLRSVPTS